jgi:hypothetical protein
MKASAFAALMLFASGGTPLAASPVASGANSATVYSSSQALKHVQANKKKKKRRQAQGPPYIPGWVLTPYGRRDCIGRWHWHEDGGWYHCHGQLIKPW